MPNNPYPKEVTAALNTYGDSVKRQAGYGTAGADKPLEKALPGSTPHLRELLKKRKRQQMGLE